MLFDSLFRSQSPKGYQPISSQEPVLSEQEKTMLATNYGIQQNNLKKLYSFLERGDLLPTTRSSAQAQYRITSQNVKLIAQELGLNSDADHRDAPQHKR